MGAINRPITGLENAKTPGRKCYLLRPGVFALDDIHGDQGQKSAAPRLGLP